MTNLSIDKTAVWFGVSPADDTIHAIHRTHRLCDSMMAADHTPVVTDTNRKTCGRCIELLNNAVHDPRGAHYGRH